MCTVKLEPFQTIRSEMDFYYSLENNPTKEGFLAYLNWQVLKVSNWIEKGHNVESNSSYLNAVKEYLSLIEKNQ